MRSTLGTLIGRTIHDRMVGTERTTSDFGDEADPDVMFASMSAYDVLDVLERAGWQVTKKEITPPKR